jgi:enamine deaminase RidA (YjgF/YER057c/UK114 family)
MKSLTTIAICALLFFACEKPNDNAQASPSPEPAADLYDYDVEERIASIGIVLSEPTPPVANYVNTVRTGNLVFMAGKGPSLPEGGYITGKVGVDLTVEEGYAAARLAAAAQLSALKAEIGDLNKVVRIVKVLGMVNAAPDFENQPEVINGFSDVMVEVFGDRGKHARAAVGMASLPRGICVEVEFIVEVRD